MLPRRSARAEAGRLSLAISRLAYALALLEVAGTGALVAWVVLTNREPPATAPIVYAFLGLFAIAMLVFAIPALVVARRGTQPWLALLLALVPPVLAATAYWLTEPG